MKNGRDALKMTEMDLKKMKEIKLQLASQCPKKVNCPSLQKAYHELNYQRP